MIQVPLQALPNQSLSIQLDGVNFDIVIRSMPTTSSIMAIDISADGVLLVAGQRMIPGYFFIPYMYLEHGNFVMLTDDGDYPDYTKFQISQFLVYIPQSEIEAIYDTSN